MLLPELWAKDSNVAVVTLQGMDLKTLLRLRAVCKTLRRQVEDCAHIIKISRQLCRLRSALQVFHQATDLRLLHLRESDANAAVIKRIFQCLPTRFKGTCIKFSNKFRELSNTDSMAVADEITASPERRQSFEQLALYIDITPEAVRLLLSNLEGLRFLTAQVAGEEQLQQAEPWHLPAASNLGSLNLSLRGHQTLHLTALPAAIRVHVVGKGSALLRNVHAITASRRLRSLFLSTWGDVAAEQQWEIISSFRDLQFINLRQLLVPAGQEQLRPLPSARVLCIRDCRFHSHAAQARAGSHEHCLPSCASTLAAAAAWTGCCSRWQAAACSSWRCCSKTGQVAGQALSLQQGCYWCRSCWACVSCQC